MLKNTLHASHKNCALRYDNDCLSEFGYGPPAIEILEGKNVKKSRSNNPGVTYEMPQSKVKAI